MFESAVDLLMMVEMQTPIICLHRIVESSSYLSGLRHFGTTSGE